MSKVKKKYLRPGEVSRLLGVSTQTLKNWDKKGIFVPHHRLPSGHRYYTPEQVEWFKRDYFK